MASYANKKLRHQRDQVVRKNPETTTRQKLCRWRWLNSTGDLHAFAQIHRLRLGNCTSIRYAPTSPILRVIVFGKCTGWLGDTSHSLPPRCKLKRRSVIEMQTNWIRMVERTQGASHRGVLESRSGMRFLVWEMHCLWMLRISHPWIA